MSNSHKRNLALALTVMASLSSACGSKKKSSDPATDGTSPTSSGTTVSKSGAAATIPVTVSTVSSKLALAETMPANVYAYALKLGSDKKVATPTAAAAIGKVDAKGKAGLKLAPGYYEVVSKMADGTEHRSSVMHVVKSTATKLRLATTTKPLVLQLDNDSKVARDLAKRVMTQDPDLFTASGLNLGLVFKEAQNLQNAATKKKATISDKDKAASAKAIASETKKNAEAVNKKAAQKKVALYLDDDSVEGSDAYAQTMSAVDEQAMNPDIAAKYSTDDVDPRKLYRDAEAALVKASTVDADVLKEMQALDSDDVAQAMLAFTGDDVPDLLQAMALESAMGSMIELLELNQGMADLTDDQYAALLASIAVELEGRSVSDLNSIFTELSDGDVDASTTDPLLQILAKAEAGGTASEIMVEVADVSAAFSADEQALLSSYTDEAKADVADEQAAEADAGEQQKEIDSAAAGADESVVE